MEVSARSRLVARTLDALRPHLDGGRLAIGFIHEHYSQMAPASQRIQNPKAMGAVLRGAGLTIAPGKHDANGKRGVNCLAWDEKTERFIKACLQCPESHEQEESEAPEVEEPMSAKSAAPEEYEDHEGLGDSMSPPATGPGTEPQAFADIMEVEI